MATQLEAVHKITARLRSDTANDRPTALRPEESLIIIQYVEALRRVESFALRLIMERSQHDSTIVQLGEALDRAKQA